MNKNIEFMAFSVKQQEESINNQLFNRYVGVRNVKVLAINPTEAELNEIYDSQQKPIEYKGEDREGNPIFNIVFILKSADDDGQIYRKYFTMRNAKVESKDGNTLCIDKYGRTAYISKEDMDAHKKPAWAERFDETATIGISKDYRPAAQGERELIAFIKAYLAIRDRLWDQESGKFIDNPNMQDRECSFENIGAIVKGDLTELKAIFQDSINPKNELDGQSVKVMLGVRVKDDGKLNNVIYPNVFLPWHARASKVDGMYYEFKRALNDDAERNLHMDTTYSAADATEFVAPTPVTMAEYTQESPVANDIINDNDDDDLPF